MEVKASQMASWDAMCSPPWEHHRFYIPIGFIGWP